MFKKSYPPSPLRILPSKLDLVKSAIAQHFFPKTCQN